MKVSILGSDGSNLCQIPQLRAGFMELGHEHTFDVTDPDVNFVFVGNPPFDQYLDLSQNKKTIFNVLDICPHCVEHAQIVERLKQQLPKSSRITAISKTVAAELKEKCGVDAEVIYYPMKPVKPTGVKKFPQFKAMLIGRTGDANKRTGAAISTLIHAGFNEHEVVVVGPEYMGYGTRMGIVSDETLNDLYNSVDYVMMMSKNEGIGLPAIEAAVCGAIPIIAPDLSTFDEFWVQSPLALHYQGINSISDAAKLIRAIEDNKEWKEQIKADLTGYASLAFVPKFTAKAVAARIISLYHTI